MNVCVSRGVETSEIERRRRVELALRCCGGGGWYRCADEQIEICDTSVLHGYRLGERSNPALDGYRCGVKRSIYSLPRFTVGSRQVVMLVAHDCPMPYD